MNCDKYRENISAWLDEELQDEEYRDLMRHMKTCEDCRRAFENARELQAAIDHTMPKEDFAVPDRVWQNINQKISSAPKHGILVRFIRYTAAAAAAAAAVMLMMHQPASGPGVVCQSLSSEEALAAELAGAVLMGEENMDLDDVVAASYSRQAMNRIMEMDDF